MAKLTIVVEVDDDPAHADPHDIGSAIVDSYEIDLRHGAAGPPVRFVSAEWTL